MGRLLTQVGCFVVAAALTAAAEAYVSVSALGHYDPKWDPATAFTLGWQLGVLWAALGGLLFAMALTGRGRRAARPGPRPPLLAAAVGALYALHPLVPYPAWLPEGASLLWLLWIVGVPLAAGYVLARAG